MIIRLTRMTGETAPADSSGDQVWAAASPTSTWPRRHRRGQRRGADYRFQQGQPTTASARPRPDLEATITKKARAQAAR
jgi:hypothetical protein